MKAKPIGAAFVMLVLTSLHICSTALAEPAHPMFEGLRAIGDSVTPGPCCLPRR